MKFESSVTRRSFVTGATGAAVFGLSACNGNETKKGDVSDNKKEADTQQLIVFAAASLTESLTEVGDLFKNANQGVDISFNFDSSGTLKTQIEQGSDCDIFISAGQKQMNQLDANAKKDHDKNLDFIASDTRFDILENKVTLCVPQDNPKAVKSFDDMATKLTSGEILFGMGNSDVPVGQYTQKILKYYKLDEETLAKEGHISYGTNVKEVATQVKEASVDCGVIYKTDATSAKLQMVDEATEEMCGRVVYPAAVIKNVKQVDVAKKFLEFLKTSDASACFEKVGFTPLSKA